MQMTMTSRNPRSERLLPMLRPAAGRGVCRGTTTVIEEHATQGRIRRTSIAGRYSLTERTIDDYGRPLRRKSGGSISKGDSAYRQAEDFQRVPAELLQTPQCNGRNRCRRRRGAAQRLRASPRPWTQMPHLRSPMASSPSAALWWELHRSNSTLFSNNKATDDVSYQPSASKYGCSIQISRTSVRRAV